AAVSFFLLLFLSLERAVGMWKNPQADRAVVTNGHFDHTMVNRRPSSQRLVRRTDAHSDVVPRGHGYKECEFSGMPEKATEEMKDQEQIVAWMGVDWADEGHHVWEYNVGTGGKENYAVQHSAESLQEWLSQVRSRYEG